MSAYPKSFVPVISQLSEYSRNKIRVNCTANTTFNPYDVTVIDLPEGKLDNWTFSIGGVITTTTPVPTAPAGGGNAPAQKWAISPSVEQLIDSMYVEVGGIAIHPSLTNYNQIWDIYANYKGTYNKYAQRSILNLEPGTKTGQGTAPQANMTSVPFQMNNFLGYMNDVRINHTDLMPPMRLYIRWASPNILATSAASAQASYYLSNVFCTIDYLTVSPLYNAMIQDKLSSSALQIPYTNFTSIFGAAGTTTGSVRWSTTANCLEMVMGTFLNQAYNSPSQTAYNVNTFRSGFFTKGGTNIAGSAPGAFTSQFSVNGIQYPQIPMDFGRLEIYLETLQCFSEDKDLTTETNPNFSSISNYGNNFFVHAHSFTFNDGDSHHRLCGLSGAGNQLIGSWTTNATVTDNVLPLIILQHKSILEIGSGKSIRYIH